MIKKFFRKQLKKKRTKSKSISRYIAPFHVGQSTAFCQSLQYYHTEAGKWKDNRPEPENDNDNMSWFLVSLFWNSQNIYGLIIHFPLFQVWYMDSYTNNKIELWVQINCWLQCQWAESRTHVSSNGQELNHVVYNGSLLTLTSIRVTSLSNKKLIWESACPTKPLEWCWFPQFLPLANGVGSLTLLT